MATFSTFNKAPGVYIQEITLPGPLPQVSTSIAAFVGPAATGPLNQPTLLTSVKQFNDKFGTYVEDPYRIFAAHAVNGFFAEGGQQCYFVRVGNGNAAWLDLIDLPKASTTLTAASAAAATTATLKSVVGLHAGDTVTLTQAGGGGLSEKATIASIAGNVATFTAPLVNAYAVGSTVLLADTQATLRVTALQEGTGGNIIKVQVDAANIASTTVPRAALTAAAAAGATSVTVAAGDAASFKPNDNVTIKGATTENAAVTSISGTTINLKSALANPYAIGDTIGLANLPAGLQELRVADVTNFEPGSYVQISNGTDPDSYDVVRVVNGVTQTLTLTNGLTNSYSVVAAALNVKSMEFTLTVTSPKAGTEVFAKLAMDQRHSHYYGTSVDSQAVVVTPSDPPNTTPPPKNLPNPIPATNLTNGVDDNLNGLGVPEYKKGIDTLQKFDVDLLCIPDAVSSHFKAVDTQAIQAAMIAHCQNMQDRFAILDAVETPASASDFSAVSNQRQGLNSNNGFGALYFPWIGISNPFGSGQIYVPPSGHTAGVYSFNDNTFDVAHAPANEPIANALSVEVRLSDSDQGPLNEQGINVIRSFSSGGIVIWGARTIAPPDRTAWRYVNVRRLLLYIEKTLREGTREFVFAPNNLTTWQQIKRLVTDFLTQLWQAGDLFGATPDQAFRVRVDETLNTGAVVALGQLIVEVTVVPTHPAEFIVFQVIQDPTGASLKESTT
jgi:Bacteriophage tail sheath protein